MQVHIDSEVERDLGWSFEAQVGARRVNVTLSWADYNYWSPDGRDEPSYVASVVLELMSELGPENIPLRFDASMVRRVIEGSDERVRGHMR
ncbi:MAG: hypothetical protein MK095_00880 [Phycisphaerales bacterium]|nr:hypothetical protein [Phycisphaerales bacterium]